MKRYDIKLFNPLIFLIVMALFFLSYPAQADASIKSFKLPQEGVLDHFSVQLPKELPVAAPFNAEIIALDSYGSPIKNYQNKNKRELEVLIAMGKGVEGQCVITNKDFKEGRAQVELYSKEPGKGVIVVREKEKSEIRGASAVVHFVYGPVHHFIVRAQGGFCANKPFRMGIEARDKDDNLIYEYNLTGKGVIVKTTGTGNISPQEIPGSDFIEGKAWKDFIYDKDEDFTVFVEESPILLETQPFSTEEGAITSIKTQLTGQTLVKRLIPERKKEREEYRLRTEDSIRVSVWGLPELSQEVTIRIDGKISFPLIGDIEAEGMTVEELVKVLTEKLAVYVKDPKVGINITKYAPEEEEKEKAKKVYIFGEVASTGLQTFDEEATLLEMIASVGGLTTTANYRRVTLTRESGEQIFVDLNKVIIEGRRELDVSLEGGETIYVPPAKMVFLLGEVKKPGAYTLPSDREKSIFELAYVDAGGPTTDAVLRDVKVVRGNLGNPQVIDVDLAETFKKIQSGKPVLQQTFLKPGDIVYIPRSVVGNVKQFLAETLQPAVTNMLLWETASDIELRAARRTTGGTSSQ